MKLSKLSFAVIAATCAMAGAAQAEVKNSGNVSFVTDYKFRGISQTSNNAAIQGAMTFTHDSGAYFTAWGSSIANVNGGLELDTLLGYAGTSGDFSYDVGVMRYNYPGNDNSTRAAGAAYGSSKRLAYNEAYASVSAYGGKVGAAVSDDYFGDTGKFYYLYGEYSKEIADGFSVVSHVGYNHLQDAAAYNKLTGFANPNNEKSYVDYKLGVTKTVAGIGFDLSYVGTDVKKANDPGRIAQGSAILTATKSF